MNRVIIAGSRGFNNPAYARNKLEQLFWQGPPGLDGLEGIDEVVCGMAPGGDMIGHRWAKSRGIEVAEFPAEWDRYGPAAGPIRNLAMAQYAAQAPNGKLVAFWDGISPGTKSMIQVALDAGLEVHVYQY